MDILYLLFAAPRAERNVACQEMPTIIQGIPVSDSEPAVGNLVKAHQSVESLLTAQGTPVSKTKRGSKLADDAGFSSEIFVRVMEKCFSKEDIHRVVDKCVEAEKQAFQSLERTRAKARAERLRLLSACRPFECDTVADLLRWLVLVRNKIYSPFYTTFGF